VFASAGLLLAALGIYGVLAYSVARRTREIGIRMALGAERGQVLALVMAEGARLIVVGAALGLLAAFWLRRLLRNQLFEAEVPFSRHSDFDCKMLICNALASIL